MPSRELPIIKKDVFASRRTFSTATPLFVLSANPTDAVIIAGGFANKIYIRKVTISGFADTSATIEVMLQNAPNGFSGATFVSMFNAPFGGYNRTGTSTTEVNTDTFSAYFTSTPTGRNGISNDRPIIAKDILQFSTPTLRGNQVVFSFADNADIRTMPALVDNVGWIVVNLNAQSMPANAKLQVSIEYEQIRMPRISMCGDSTYSNAGTLMQSLNSGNDLFLGSIENLGCNGQPLSAFITPASTGIGYPLASVYTRAKDICVIGYGINDVRLGNTNQAQLTAMLETVIVSMLATNPECKIILHGPNSLASNDPNTTNFLVLSGIFAGMTIAQAAQLATDIMYNAYESFRNDTRIMTVVQRQDVVGRVCQTVAASTLMTDILHPNGKGQKLIARQLSPVLSSAIQSVLDNL